MENKKLNIVLLVGGTSPERQVSKATGASIYTALLTLGHNVTVVDPAYGLKQPESVDDFFKEKEFAEISNKNYLDAINNKIPDTTDLVFIALHGRWGEDGTVQSLLELKGLKYTGSGVLSSAISMDKVMSKILFGHYNISTPKWLAYDKLTINYETAQEEIKNKISFPCVIKPADQGSTVGLTVCSSVDQVNEAVKLAFQFSDKVLIEEYIEGYEMTVGVIENKALPVVEIKPKHGLYDYECKYTSGMSVYIVPAEITPEVAKVLQEQSLLAFNALGCKGYGRADFRVDKNYVPYCLEINTLPGMTSTSLVPKMAKAAGIKFEELIEMIIRLSLNG